MEEPNIPGSIKNCDRETLEKLAWGWYQELLKYEREAHCKLVNRIEVINGTGRAYSHKLTDDEFVWSCYQDGGRTLKVFIDKYAEGEW